VAELRVRLQPRVRRDEIVGLEAEALDRKFSG
jgi:hypothetical protein